jgi:hypothetical protein
MADNFYDTSYFDTLKRQIKERLAKPTLAEELQEQSEQKEARKMNWTSEIKEYWYIYIPVFISGLFTLTLGVYLGLDPQRRMNADGSQVIYWNTDWGHVLMAIIIAAAFLVVTEVMFVIGKVRYQTREEGNNTQRITSWWVTAIAALSVAITGIAGFRVVASNIAMLTEFRDIPRTAQLWVSIAIPVLLTTYLILLTAYANSSMKAKTKRTSQQAKERQQLDHQLQMDMIDLIGEEQFQAAEIELYKDLVMKGKITAAQATAARRAGKTLQQMEKDMGRDLNEDGHVGEKVPVASLTASKNGKTENFR